VLQRARETALLNKPRDSGADLAYEEPMIRAAATYFGYWFSYPLTLAEAGARSI
jgi:hypothetical protein